MEEKKYPTHEEEENVGLVNEPIAEPIIASPQTRDGITRLVKGHRGIFLIFNR